MRVIFLGCGYLGYNLSVRLPAGTDMEMWGITSPYSDRQPAFKLVNVLNREELCRQNVQDAVIVDTVGLIARSEKADDEAEKLERLKQKQEELLAVLRQGGARRYVFLSSGGTIYGSSAVPVREEDPLQPQTLYARSKRIGEQAVQESGLPYLILRLANPYGGYQDAAKKQGVIPILLRKALKGEVFEQTTADSSVRDYLYISDLSAVLNRLLELGTENEILNVGSGRGTTLLEIKQTVEQETGRKLKVVSHPDPGQVAQIVLNTGKLRRLTGFVPQVSLREGIHREAERIRWEEGL